LITASDGKEYKITKDMVTIEMKKEVINVVEYTPNVIEPSFGIGRIIYTLLEHSYYTRESDEQRAVFAFPPAIAPIKVLVVPLSNHKDFVPLTNELMQKFRKNGLMVKCDDSSGSIGRRYARNDELGTPFGVTVDFQSVKDRTVTLRERDSTKQVRGQVEDVVNWINELVNGTRIWSELVAQVGEFSSQDAE
jgi:glycyl-tRNA synthetase